MRWGIDHRRGGLPMELGASREVEICSEEEEEEEEGHEEQSV